MASGVRRTRRRRSREQPAPCPKAAQVEVNLLKVCVIGLGYVGFPTACMLAQAGHTVVGVDVDQRVVEHLGLGIPHITTETGLAELAKQVLHSGRLRASAVVEPADVFIIAVPTPLSPVDRGHGGSDTGAKADLSHVESAARAIAPWVQPGDLVILESTVPPRTTETVVGRILTDAGVDLSQVFLAYAPERVLPGAVLRELVHNPRIVGGVTPEAAERTRAFYETFVRGEVVVTDAVTAETVKLMENTFRSVNIALANEFARICERLGVDVWTAINLANRHPRVQFLRPGPGVGGHCIAIDPQFVVQVAPNETALIQTAHRINRSMPTHVMDLFRRLTAGMSVQRVAILGAAYKADVADERESPSLEIARRLEAAGYQVLMHDPHIQRFCRPVDDVLAGADVVILATDHSLYRDLDPVATAARVGHRALLDARGFLDAQSWRAAGFQVAQLGAGQRSEIGVRV